MSNPQPPAPPSSPSNTNSSTIQENNNTTTTKPPPNFRPLFLFSFAAAPVLAVLPPRKLDLYTLALCGIFVISGVEVFTGAGSGYAERRRVAWILQQQQQEDGGPASVSSTAGAIREDALLLANARAKALARRQEGEERGEEEGGLKGMAAKLWYGNQGKNWKEKRLEEEREMLAGGEGYWGIISKQVGEVLGAWPDKEEVEEEREKWRRGEGIGISLGNKKDEQEKSES